MANKIDRQLDALLLGLGFEAPRGRGSDSLDFKELNVEVVRDALRAAWHAGLGAGIQHADKEGK